MTWGYVAVGAGTLIAGVLSKPKAPKAVTPATIDANKAVSDSLSANSANFNSAAALSKRTNDFNQSEATRLLEKSIPGFGAIQSKLLSKVNEDLSSDGLSPDVKSNLQRLAAERGITRGTSGGFNDFNLVKDFGFNLVDFENAKRARALTTLSSVYGMAPRVNPMTPMASFVTPNTLLGAQQSNEQARQGQQQGQANADAAASNANSSMWGGVASTIVQGFGSWAANKTATPQRTAVSTPTMSPGTQFSS